MTARADRLHEDKGTYSPRFVIDTRAKAGCDLQLRAHGGTIQIESLFLKPKPASVRYKYLGTFQLFLRPINTSLYNAWEISTRYLVLSSSGDLFANSQLRLGPG